MWVTWKELKVPSYPLGKKLGPIHQNVDTIHTHSLSIIALRKRII